MLEEKSILLSRLLEGAPWKDNKSEAVTHIRHLCALNLCLPKHIVPQAPKPTCKRNDKMVGLV